MEKSFFNKDSLTRFIDMLPKSKAEDFASKLLIKLVKADKYYDVTNNFHKLETDEDRVKFTLNVMEENDFIPHVINKSKSAEESERLREEGNKAFASCNFNSAMCHFTLGLYTKSIALAPHKSKQLALAYANRSAVLFDLGLYSECIQDIDRALALSYPDDLKGKLYMRKTHCLIILGDQTAKSMIEETEHWINKMELNHNKLKLQTKLDGLRRKTEQKNIQSNSVKLQESEPSLPVIRSYNKEIPCASDAIALKYDKNNGRHIVATRNIDTGEVLVVEKPYSMLLAQENAMTHCSNCLKICWATIPCKYCIYAMYCSEQCRDIEWRKCHDVECAVFNIMVNHGFYNSDLLSLRLSLLAIREAGNIQELRTMLKNADKSDDPRTMGFSQDGKFYSDKYISLHSLERNTKKRPFLDIFRRTVDACFILYILTSRTEFFDAKLPNNLKALAKNQNVTFMGALILRHQQILPTNVHSFCEEREFESAQRGLAAMPFCSLFNHSCHPNIIRISTAQHMVLYALYPVRKGEQLLDNYGSHHALTPKLSRQKQLLEHYFFTCTCVACEENWPLFCDFKPFDTLVKSMKDINIITHALRNFDMYVDLASKGDVLNKPNIIEDLLMMIRVLYDRVPLTCKEMGDVVETLKRVYSLHGNKYVLPTIQTHDK